MSQQKVKQLVQLLDQWQSGAIILRGPSGCGKTTALTRACSSLNLTVREIQDQFDLALSKLDSLGVKQVAVTRDSATINSVGQTRYVIPVFILAESDLSYRRNQTPLLVVSFNAYSDSAIRGIILGLNADIPDDILAETVAMACGDARQARIHLALRGLLSSEGNKCVVKTKRKRILSSERGGVRDNSFSLFHTLGKVLYNKRGIETDCIALASQPVVSDSGKVAISCLHENLPDFTSDISTMKSLAAEFSFLDAFLQFSEHANWFIFRAITVLNKTNSDAQTGRLAKGFNSFRRPSSIACKDILLREIRSEIQCIKPHNMHLIDLMMRESGGVFPNLSVPTRNNVFNFINRTDWALEKADCFFPTELQDDPIRD